MKIIVPFLTRNAGTEKKLFDGPFNKVPQYMRDMDIFLSQQGKLAKKFYFYFATCPNCARKYGHNYIVAFAEV
jgi:hypothetical protein